MIITTDAERGFDELQYPFMIKNSQQIKYTESILYHNKGHMWQAHS